MYELNAVWANSRDDAWAVGWYGTVLHWDGTSWTQVSTNIAMAYDYTSIWSEGPNDVWVVGSTTWAGIVHWDGNSWTDSSSSVTTETYLRSVWGDAPNDVWAFGSAWINAVSTEGKIFRWNGTK